MLLSDLNIIGQEGLKQVLIENGRIKTISLAAESIPTEPIAYCLNLNGALAFPGLINSHDHLDFNLFPQIGNKVYRNYIEWGADIQVNNKDRIDSILKIPEALRVKWGIYKNLLAGVTTVVNHGKKLAVEEALINVFQQSQSIHSIDREKYWRLRLNRLYKRNERIAIHIGEGTDESSHLEIDELIKWNFLKRPVVGIHGVAMDRRQAAAFEALVWCPCSNDFLYGKTAAVDILKYETTMLFGTDSTLTGSWNIWDHLRAARRKHVVTEGELFDMVTVNAAKIWKMDDQAKLAEGFFADIVIAEQPADLNAGDSFYGLNPENILLIVQHGNIKLFDAGIVKQVEHANVPTGNFSKISINGYGKYVAGDLPGLIKEIWKYNRGVVFPVSIE